MTGSADFANILANKTGHQNQTSARMRASRHHVTAVCVWTHGRSVSASLVSAARTRSGLIKIDAIHVLTGLKAPHESRPTCYTSPHPLSFLLLFFFGFLIKWHLYTLC